MKRKFIHIDELDNGKLYCSSNGSVIDYLVIMSQFVRGIYEKTEEGDKEDFKRLFCELFSTNSPVWNEAVEITEIRLPQKEEE